jgi:serine/threonine-protein kinase
MAAESLNRTESEQRLDEVVVAYLKSLEAGQTPDPEEWLRRYPDLAAELHEFFADQAEVRRWTAPLRPLAPATPPPGATDTPVPAVPETADRAPAAPLPTLGDYELLAVIGRGGMGAVFEARQKSLNRTVALKMIRTDPAAFPAEGRRFRNEAEMAAGLDHPNIVPVYEVAEHAGQLYFSMKRIEGGSLAVQLDHFAADPKSAARLMAQVARAVHHAHQRGILHRDLKPANILLDAQGQPHVTDFGLAKRIEVDSSLTQSGMLVGTPSYMAPEQALGKKGAVTTATDVYGLGAVLYALLTGRPPLQGETILETLEKVKGQEPEPASKSNPRVDRDLETVCLKCLDKDPHQRYGSAEGLAEDLERWLKGEPIRARPLRLVARVWRWCRRYPVVASLTAAAAVLLVTVVAGLAGGLIVLSAKEKELQDALDQAQGQERAAGRQQQRAEENLDVAYQVLDQIYLDLADNRLPRERQLGPEDRRLLEKAFTFYQHFTRQNNTDRRVREQTAKAYLRVGAIEDKLGQSEKARDAYRQALTLWDQLVAEFPGRADYRLNLARGYASLAWVGGVNEKHGPKDEQLLGKAVALQEKLVKASPGQVEYRRDLGMSHFCLGWILLETGRYRPAEEAMGRAIAIREKLAQEKPGMLIYRQELSMSLGNLGWVLMKTHRLGEARQVLRRNLELRQRLAEAFPGSAEARHYLADGYMDLARLEDEAGRYQEAREGHRQELLIREKLAAEFPGVSEYQNRLAICHNNLGGTFWRRRQVDEAIAEFREALRINKDDAGAHNNLGVALKAKGRLDEAITEFREAVRINKDYADAHNNLGVALKAKGRLDEAITEFREAVRLKKDFAEAHCNLGLVLVQKGQFLQAVEELSRGHEVGSRNPRWPYPSAQWLRDAHRMADLEARLPRILKGEAKPADGTECLAVARLCQQHRKLYAAAARFFSEAFAAEPKLAGGEPSPHRYNAACAASLAGCGQGSDAASLDDKERSRLRQQARDWLRAELEAWRRWLDKGPDRARAAAVQQLQHWLADPDFAGVRGEEALTRLPEGEWQAWQKLWADVGETLAKAGGLSGRREPPETKP